MKKLIIISGVILFLGIGCTKEIPDQPKMTEKDVAATISTSTIKQIEVPGAESDSFITNNVHGSEESQLQKTMHAFDFDNDGFDEHVVYYQKALLKPERDFTYNGAFKIFQYIDHRWTEIYEDEGTVGKDGYGIYNQLTAEHFYKVVDIDSDSTPEIRIMSEEDGSGGYSNQYILKWNKDKIIKADFTETKTKIELENQFLNKDEVFGPGGLNYISICSTTIDTHCTFKQGAPGAVGYVIKGFEYNDGVFTATSYRRVNTDTLKSLNEWLELMKYFY